MGKFLLGMVAAALLAAALTVPSKDDAEATLRSQLLSLLQDADLGDHDAATATALALCKLQSGACYDLVRRGIDVQYTHRWLYADYRIEGFDRRADCIGAFGRFVCPGGLQRP